MNGLRTRLNLTLDREQQKPLNEAARMGDRIVGWVGCIGLAVFIIYELSGRFL